MPPPRKSAAFTLLELLFTITLIGILAAIVFPVATSFRARGERTRALQQARQLGLAIHLYANEHDQSLPSRPSNASLFSPGTDAWPRQIAPYLQNLAALADPGDPVGITLPLQSLISNTQNNTSFVFNGFNDAGTIPLLDGLLNLGALFSAERTVRLPMIERPSETLLLAPKQPGATPFYYDVLSPTLDLVATKQRDDGGHYVFADGSVRFLTEAEYSPSLWLIGGGLDLSQLPILPPLPLPPLPQLPLL